MVLWPASADVADDLPTRIDVRFELRPRDSLVRKLEDARAEELARRQEALAAIERGLAEAREAFVAQRFDDMEAGLLAIQNQYLALLAEPANCGSLWEIEFRLGLAYQFRGTAGDEQRMQERYVFALELDRARRPARELYGPEVLAAFLAAVDASTGRVGKPLRVGVRPKDASVHVDCRPASGGRIDVASGLHVVHAAGPALAAQAVVVQTETMTAVEPVLAPYASDDAIVRFGATTDDGAIDPRSTGARRALVGATTKWGAEVTVLVWPKDGKAAARALVGAADGPVVVRDSFEQAIAAALLGVDDAGRLRAAPSAIVRDTPRDPEPRKRKPVVRTWWFWTIIGVVVAGGVGLAVGLTVPKREPDRLVITGPR